MRPTERMQAVRVGVIGAGAVGGTIAALLDRHGHDVEVTARGAHAHAIAEHGLRLSGAWGEHTARVTVSPALTRRPELALITTKAQDAAAAMVPAARLLDGVPVVVVQNGLEGVSTAAQLLPGSHVLGALALFAASFLSPGEVSVTAAGGLFLGRHDAVSGIPCLFAERTLAEVLPVTPVDDFAGAQWTKLVINQVNAFPAITGLSVQEVIADRDLRAALTASMREAIRIGLASGVRFASLQGLSHPLLRLVASAPPAVAGLLPRVMASRMGDVPNPGSTLQSIRRGQATEIDYLNGAVVRAARAIGRTAPINEEIVRLVHEVEAGDGFVDRDLVAAIGR